MLLIREKGQELPFLVIFIGHCPSIEVVMRSGILGAGQVEMERREMDCGCGRISQAFSWKLALRKTPHPGQGRRDNLRRPKITQETFH